MGLDDGVITFPVDVLLEGAEEDVFEFSAGVSVPLSFTFVTVFVFVSVFVSVFAALLAVFCRRCCSSYSSADNRIASISIS